jgi:hypothetical protein
MVDYFCHLCRKLLAHDRSAETERDVLVKLKLYRLLLGKHPLELAVFGKMVPIIHGPIINKVLLRPCKK